MALKPASKPTRAEASAARAERVAARAVAREAREAKKNARTPRSATPAPATASAPKTMTKSAPASNSLFLAVTTTVHGENIEVNPTHYVVDGAVYPRSMVVAIVGKTFYVRSNIALGELATVIEKNGTYIYKNTDGQNIIVFDAHALSLVCGTATYPAPASSTPEAESVEDHVVYDGDEEEEETRLDIFEMDTPEKGAKDSITIDDEYDDEGDDSFSDLDEDEPAPKDRKPSKPSKDSDDEGSDDEFGDFED